MKVLDNTLRKSAVLVNYDCRFSVLLAQLLKLRALIGWGFFM